MARQRITAAEVGGGFLRTPEVLKLLGISRPTLWAWRKSGLFPEAVRLGPNTVGWKTATVQDWISSRPAA